MLTTFASPFHGALYCAKRGFKVFPCADKTKKPLVKWRDESTDDLEKLNAWDRKWPGANYAIDCGKSNLCAIDLDVKGGKNGIASFERYCDENFLGSDVLTTITPSGGQHRFFNGSAKTTTEWLPGVDVRSSGGYVVAPGSVLKTGGAYLLKEGESLELPQFVGESIGQANVRAPVDSMEPPAGGWDKPSDIARAIVFLAHHAKPAVEGESGDRQTFVTACLLKDMGISAGKALELMVQYYNDRCAPPWDPSEMAVKVDSAYRPGRMNKPGSNDPAAAFADCPLPEEETDSEDWLNWSNSQHMPRKQRPWYVPGWFPRGSATPTLFAGPGGAGKTLAAMQAALSIRTGIPLWGITPACTAGAALLVLCEDDNDEIINRLNDIREATPAEFIEQLEACDVKLMSMVGRDCMMVHAKDGKVKRGPFFKRLDDRLTMLGGPEVDKWVAIDTAADVFAGDECDRSAVNAFVKYHLIELGIKHNATITLLAHPAKAEGSTYSGSTAWNNSFRHRLFMDYYDPKKPDDFRRISVAKSNYQRSGDSLTLRYDRGVFVRATDDEVKCGYATAVYAAIDNAVECGEPLARAKQASRCIYDQPILDALGHKLSREAISAGLDELLVSGQVEERKGKNRGNGLFPARVVGLDDYTEEEEEHT